MANFRFNEKKDFLDYFCSEVMGTNALEEAIDWIRSKLSPDQVFNIDQLEEWAEGVGYTKEGKNAS